MQILTARNYYQFLYAISKHHVTLYHLKQFSRDLIKYLDINYKSEIVVLYHNLSKKKNTNNRKLFCR